MEKQVSQHTWSDAGEAPDITDEAPNETSVSSMPRFRLSGSDEAKRLANTTNPLAFIIQAYRFQGEIERFVDELAEWIEANARRSSNGDRGATIRMLMPLWLADSLRETLTDARGPIARLLECPFFDWRNYLRLHFKIVPSAHGEIERLMSIVNQRRVESIIKGIEERGSEFSNLREFIDAFKKSLSKIEIEELRKSKSASGFVTKWISSMSKTLEDEEKQSFIEGVTKTYFPVSLPNLRNLKDWKVVGVELIAQNLLREEKGFPEKEFGDTWIEIESILSSNYNFYEKYFRIEKIVRTIKEPESRWKIWGFVRYAVFEDFRIGEDFSIALPIDRKLTEAEWVRCRLWGYEERRKYSGLQEGELFENVDRFRETVVKMESSCLRDIIVPLAIRFVYSRTALKKNQEDWFKRLVLLVSCRNYREYSFAWEFFEDIKKHKKNGWQIWGFWILATLFALLALPLPLALGMILYLTGNRWPIRFGQAAIGAGLIAAYAIGFALSNDLIKVSIWESDKIVRAHVMRYEKWYLRGIIDWGHVGYVSVLNSPSGLSTGAGSGCPSKSN